MTERLRVGVVGIGFGQSAHVPAFREAGCEVVAIAASDAERAVTVARRLGISRAFADWRDLVAESDVHIVSIAVPPRLQPEIAVAAARAGRHLLCEKPVAADVRGAALMLAAAEDAGVRHAVDFEFPELPSWRLARERLEEGVIGRLEDLSIEWRTRTRSRPTGHWKGQTEEGGGVLGGFLSHALYDFEWFAGPIGRLRARLSGEWPTRAEVWIEGGARGTIDVDASAAEPTGHRLELRGVAGTIRLDDRAAPVGTDFALSSSKGEERATPDQPPPAADLRIGPVASLVTRFVAAVVSAGPMRPDLSDGVRVQQLLAAVRASAVNDSWQSV